MPKDAKEESHDPAVIVTRMYDFTLWLLPKVQHFPREWRFSVGDRLIATGLDLLTALIEAAYVRNKQNALYTANNRINTLRYLLRLSKDLKILGADPYAFAAEKLDEVGRMAGGWQRSLERRA